VSVLDDIVADQIRSDLPPLAPGDTVKVSAKVVEGNRERIQVFEGTVMRLTGGGITRSVTVRALRSGVGVERTFKVNSPRIDHIEVVRHGVARRAKLYFLRDRVGKSASLRERRPRSAEAAAIAAAAAAKAASAAAPKEKAQKVRPKKEEVVMGGKKGSKR
jgi:large subunit ribosomal protein L19